MTQIELNLLTKFLYFKTSALVFVAIPAGFPLKWRDTASLIEVNMLRKNTFKEAETTLNLSIFKHLFVCDEPFQAAQLVLFEPATILPTVTVISGISSYQAFPITGVLKKAREIDIGGERSFSTALIKLEGG